MLIFYWKTIQILFNELNQAELSTLICKSFFWRSITLISRISFELMSMCNFRSYIGFRTWNSAVTFGLARVITIAALVSLVKARKKWSHRSALFQYSRLGKQPAEHQVHYDSCHETTFVPRYAMHYCSRNNNRDLDNSTV